VLINVTEETKEEAADESVKTEATDGTSVVIEPGDAAL
jgi:hypothetical protein